MILGRTFFEHDARVVGQALLGKYLVRKRARKTKAYRIIETEAYVGPHDKASHAYRGRTKRNEVMFGPPGYWYIYFTYGMHHMLNIVTGKEGYPAAVLIRGVEGITGPGRLSKALGITLRENRKKAVLASGLWIEDRGEKISPRHIKRTPRIGVSYAEEWAGKLFRYILMSQEGGQNMPEAPRKAKRGVAGLEFRKAWPPFERGQLVLYVEKGRRSVRGKRISAVVEIVRQTKKKKEWIVGISYVDSNGRRSKVGIKYPFHRDEPPFKWLESTGVVKPKSLTHPHIKSKK